jgi:hypothetical protein
VSKTQGLKTKKLPVLDGWQEMVATTVTSSSEMTKRIFSACLLASLKSGVAGYFQTKILGKFSRVLEWTMLVYFCPFGLFYVIWYIFVANWYIYCMSFGIFSPFWYVAPRKIWQPWSQDVEIGRIFFGQLFGSFFENG